MTLIKIEDREYYISSESLKKLHKWLEHNARIAVEDNIDSPEDDIIIDIAPTDSAEHLINQKKEKTGGN